MAAILEQMALRRYAFGAQRSQHGQAVFRRHRLVVQRMGEEDGRGLCTHILVERIGALPFRRWIRAKQLRARSKKLCRTGKSWVGRYRHMGVRCLQEDAVARRCLGTGNL